LVLPFWYRLTWVVPEKGPLNGCVCCVCVLQFDIFFLIFVTFGSSINCEYRLQWAWHVSLLYYFYTDVTHRGDFTVIFPICPRSYRDSADLYRDFRTALRMIRAGLGILAALCKQKFGGP